ncbi:unnamed protein product, partial [Nesidiocoris tenuis]
MWEEGLQKTTVPESRKNAPGFVAGTDLRNGSARTAVRNVSATILAPSRPAKLRAPAASCGLCLKNRAKPTEASARNQIESKPSQASARNCPIRRRTANPTARTITTVQGRANVATTAAPQFARASRQKVTLDSLQQLSSISGSKFRIHQNGTLEIILLKPDDTGVYTCEASNGIQPAATREYTLEVK